MHLNSILDDPQIAKAKTFLSKAHTLVKPDSNYNDIIKILDNFTKCMEEIADYGHQNKCQEAFTILRQILPHYRDLLNQAQIRNPNPLPKEEEMAWIDTNSSQVFFDDLHGKNEIINILIYQTIKQIRTTYQAHKPRDVTIDHTLLIYGSPGVGKTYLARAIGHEFGCKSYNISSSDLVSKYYGESEILVSKIFQRARENKPSVLIFDEIDSIATDESNGCGRRILTQLLIELTQGDNSGVLIMNLTNWPFKMNSALLKRFMLKYFISQPQENDRRDYIYNYWKTQEISLNNKLIEKMVKDSEGMSFSDMYCVFRDIMMEPLREIQLAPAMQFYYKEKNEIPVCVPCKEGSPDSIRINFIDLQPELLQGILTKEAHMDSVFHKYFNNYRGGADIEAKLKEWGKTYEK